MDRDIITSSALSSVDGATVVNFPTVRQALDTVKQKLGATGQPIVKGSPREGSSNKVTVYALQVQGSGGGGGGGGGGSREIKVAVRVAKKPSLKKMQPGGLWVPLVGTVGGHTSMGPNSQASYKTNPNAHTFDEIKQEEKKNEANWVEAHLLGLSPLLYFYGYVVPAPGSNELYLCAISEAMGDLDDFYTRGAGAAGNDIIDNNVRQQLTSLFDEMTKKMHMICFDIKPQNAVINYISPTNLTVKLIDWDADFCEKFAHLKKGRGGVADLASFTSVIMQVIMAMFFYFYYNNNIFADFFSTPGTKANLILTGGAKASLEELFCKNNTRFQQMAKWYFGHAGLKIPKEFSCEDLWNEMYKRAFYKNAAAFAAASSGGGGTGGGRRKYKRRHRKNSKRRRKTRRKRRRTRRKRHKRRHKRRRRTRRRKR